jgi:hypothetical protein
LLESHAGQKYGAAGSGETKRKDESKKKKKGKDQPPI